MSDSDLKSKPIETDSSTIMAKANLDSLPPIIPNQEKHLRSGHRNDSEKDEDGKCQRRSIDAGLGSGASPFNLL